MKLVIYMDLFNNQEISSCNSICKLKYNFSFYMYSNLVFAFSYWNLPVKNFAYFKNFWKYFIRLKCSPIYPYIREILLCYYICNECYNHFTILEDLSGMYFGLIFFKISLKKCNFWNYVFCNIEFCVFFAPLLHGVERNSILRA